MRTLPMQYENNIRNTIGCTLNSIRSERYKVCGMSDLRYEYLNCGQVAIRPILHLNHIFISY